MDSTPYLCVRERKYIFMPYKRKYLVQVFLILVLLLLSTGCSRKTYKFDNKSIVLDTENKEFREGELRYGYEIDDSTITLYYPEGYRFTYDSYADNSPVFDGDKDEYLKLKEKYVDPEELIKILRSQPKNEGILGFMGIMLLGIGVIYYFYPNMFYAIRGRGKSQFRVPSESGYSTIKKISIFLVILGALLIILYIIG